MLEFFATRRLGEFRFEARFSGPADGVTVLFGASGSGKSTALALLAGAVAADEARFVLGGRVLEDSAAGIRVPMEARQLGWVFQDGRLFPHLTVAENLAYGATRAARRRGQGGAAIDREQVLAVLGIGGILARRPRDLSGGERQRVAIGRALLAQPRLLLLDEPLASLDATRRLEILGFIEQVKREFRVPMVYVTHSLAEVVRLADYLVLLERGVVVAAGKARDLLGRADLPALARRADAGALIEGVVTSRDRQAGAAIVDVGGQSLVVPDSAVRVGEPLRLYVLASDVILAGERPSRISVRNVLACRVGRVVAEHSASVQLELELGSGRLLATLTHAAYVDMGLAPGAPVFALVKSVAIDAPAGRRLIEAGG